MVNTELNIIRTTFKTQSFFFLVPLATYAIAFVPANLSFNPHEFLAMFSFWSIIFPAIALFRSVGSLEQQELFISFPISPWKTAIIFPLLTVIIYGVLFDLALHFSSSMISGGIPLRTKMIAAIPALMFLFFFTAMVTALFKNSAIGLCLGLFFVLFGMFTTGAGQGPFYLLQWFRPKSNSGAADYVTAQYIGSTILCIITFFLVKFREKFYLLKL